jgi:hypothetical protein
MPADFATVSGLDLAPYLAVVMTIITGKVDNYHSSGSKGE